MFFNKLPALAIFLLLAGCASLPENYLREESWKLDTSDSMLTGLYQQEAAVHSGQSGAHPLGQGMEALAARIALARAADRTLDVQYYIWHTDEAGHLLLKELLDAADRGVRVRLLLDDYGVGAADDEGFMLLDSYPNVSVRLFNPIALRDARTMGFIADFGRLNHRMHNKSMTADGAVTIIGGRNIGNEYFALNELVNFADMDVLAIGPVAGQVTDSFDIFWNSPASIPISAFHERAMTQDQVARARKKLDAYVSEKGAPYYQALRSTEFSQDLKTRQLEFYWGKITAVFDQPEKSEGGGDSEVLLKQLGNLLGQAEKDLLIVSPYFVPGKAGTEALVKAVQRGARVRVFTNSLASTDVGAVHAGYKKYRRKLLEGGIELFEMLPKLQEGEEINQRLAYDGSSAASLHAKMFLFDRQRVFIGSMNLDPRSVVINTEIGLLIDSPALAQDLEAQFNAIYRELFYSVVLEPKNPGKPGGKQHMVWIEYRDGEEKRYTKDPETTFWQRFKVGFIGLLPVDSQL
jgi:putative cardiolipin synthase